MFRVEDAAPNADCAGGKTAEAAVATLRIWETTCMATAVRSFDLTLEGTDASGVMGGADASGVMEWAMATVDDGGWLGWSCADVETSVGAADEEVIGRLTEDAAGVVGGGLVDLDLSWSRIFLIFFIPFPNAPPLKILGIVDVDCRIYLWLFVAMEKYNFTKYSQVLTNQLNDTKLNFLNL
jgi:hypothetical protein